MISSMLFGNKQVRRTSGLRFQVPDSFFIGTTFGRALLEIVPSFLSHTVIGHCIIHSKWQYLSSDVSGVHVCCCCNCPYPQSFITPTKSCHTISMVENHHDSLDLLFSSYSHAMYLRHTNYTNQSVSPQWPIYQNTSHLVVSTVQAQGIKLGEKKKNSLAKHQRHPIMSLLLCQLVCGYKLPP